MYTLNFPIHYPRCNSQGLGSELKTQWERKEKGDSIKTSHRCKQMASCPGYIIILRHRHTQTHGHSVTDFSRGKDISLSRIAVRHFRF